MVTMDVMVTFEVRKFRSLNLTADAQVMPVSGSAAAGAGVGAGSWGSSFYISISNLVFEP